ncbi:MAG: hypothetical protein E7378_02605 [Clostridiales bacterium]|nr:hypothetical protein [Clostridiales bacterium]
MNFFSSDLHFGNDQALKVDARPFKNIRQFEKYVVKLWNKQTTKNDNIWIIGDFVDYHKNQDCNWQRGLAMVKKLKANVHLIIGNNEEKLIKASFDGSFDKFMEYCLKLGFKTIAKDGYVKNKKEEFYMTHKPINHHKSMLTLFGHSHRSMGVYKSFGFNIGCDLNHFRLFTEQDLHNFVKLKSEYWDEDENLKLI